MNWIAQYRIIFGYRVLGHKYILQTSEIEHIVGRFNRVMNKLLIVYDEADFSDANRATHKLKNLITATRINWEEKYAKMITVRNCARMIYTTNQSNPARIESTDRRHLLIVCDGEHAQDPEYFGKVFECIANDMAAIQFYKYLQARDISQFNPRDRVNTEAYTNLRSLSIPRVIEYMYECYVTGTHSQDELDIPGKDLYADYRIWEDLNYAGRKPTTHKRFAFEMKRVTSVAKTRKKNGMHYTFSIAALTNEIQHYFDE